MRAAITQARLGLGNTHPNPAVGAVIVADGQIIASGFHRTAGQPHAEIEALRALDHPSLAKHATIYITLEPCCTFGRTPPCTQAIIDHQFARVVYGATDPNPKHSGRANRILDAAGIKVTAGILEDDCAALNPIWNHWIATEMPWVITKCGMSLDGKISSHPESRWITCDAAREDAMHVRASVDAILIGANTARIDNPQLTVRGRNVHSQPWRVIWAPSGDLPSDLQLFHDDLKHRTWVLTEPFLERALRELGKRGILSVLIEGGGRTLGEAFDKRLVQQCIFYVAPTFIGGPVPAVGGEGAASTADAIPLANIEFQRIGSDLKISGYPGPGRVIAR